MAMDTTMTIRMDSNLKRQAEEVCSEMGLTMSAAIMMFTKRLVRDRAIPFHVTAGDPFYSETNTQHLRAAAARMEHGMYEVHDVLGDEA